ncbi:nicotinate-nucleotide--dimethylbenzimidazole phosphoribosyltransferase [Aestuariimicrobium sp. Y1814]|uniref:nicotinate-nucleotide--dimethylbenzimidazole phosphoribosyltransferase n=1 Tax=Aestuariimicrobium sp. Y1814 TaxID=3418742 RepID=UPI003DA71689
MTLKAITPASAAAVARAAELHTQLTKPPGSLGVLEGLGGKLAGIADACPPPLPTPATIGVFAGDHGVCAQGVTPWPQEVTVQMLMNMAQGGAAINVLARQLGARVVITDVGVATDHPAHDAIRDGNVRRGTADFTVGPAMTLDQARSAVAIGIRTAEQAISEGARCLLTGEMGIGNTTPSSALVAVFTGTDPAAVIGRGAGADEAMVATKTRVVTEALALHQPDPADPLAVLAAIGGLEHAALAGFILAGAAHRVPVVLDGLIACSAACAAVAWSPSVRDYLVSGHAGAEPGITVALAHLGLQPLVDLGLRLGEGTGAVLALPLVEAAARVMHEMATFSSAGVSGGGEGPAHTAAPAAAVPSERPKTTLVLGGARSGKSHWAEQQLADAPAVDYVATSQPRPEDPEWVARVQAHRNRRPQHWQTIETLDLVDVLARPGRVPVLVDCLTLWLTHQFDALGAWDRPEPEWRPALDRALDALVEAVADTGRRVLLVSNEVGSGVVPPTPSGRLFQDELGRLNSRVAARCDHVVLCTAGIPQQLK